MCWAVDHAFVVAIVMVVVVVCVRFSVHVKDVVTGEDLPDAVEWCKFGGIAWEESARGFFYSAFPRPKELEVK